MRKRYDRLKQKLRPHDYDAGPASTPPSAAPAVSTTQTLDASTQLATATGDQATYSTLSERLWTKAYDGLKEKESDLVRAYEEILSKVQVEWTETSKPSEIDTLRHCKNDEARQMWRVVYAGLERTKRQAEYKETASNFMEAINNIKGLVDKVVKYSAEASVVWVGVSLGLEILANPMKEPGLNRKAIAYVLSKMEWYWNLADVALGQKESSSPSTPPDALRNNLEGHILDFFRKLLMFQMRSACLYYRNWASIILRDTVKLDDWNGKVTELKDAEAAIRRDIQQYNSEDAKAKLASIEDNAILQAESLENIYSAIREEARRREKKEQNDEDTNCLRALYVTDPQVDKQRIQSQKHGLQVELCDWIFTTAAYEQFFLDNSKRVLWINGLPGKGKTMLACGIIDRLRTSLRPLAFYFCEGSMAKDSLSGETRAVRGLIYMLLDYQPSLMSIIRPHYEKMGEKLFDNHNSSIILVGILKEMLQDSCFHEAIVVVDALDECSGRSSLIDVINNLSQSCPTQWVLTSRPWPEIKTELSGAQGLISLSLEDEKESVSQAVKSYISITVDNLVRKWGDDADLKASISEYLYSHADNTYLWVSLVCKRLASSSIPKWCVLDELKSFPDTLDKLYEVMMARIMDSVKKDRLVQILATVCITYRRLTPAELATLMGDMKEDEVTDAINWCGSFLDCQNDEIFLVHQSAREFLVNKNLDKILPKGPEFQHHSIFFRSLESLSELLERDIYRLGTSGLSSAQISTPDPDPLAPIRYSCLYWVDHLESSKPQCGTVGHELEDDGLVHRFFRKKYLNWLEALSLLCRVPEGILAVQNLEALAGNLKALRLSELLQDARRFVLSCRPAIEVAPLQIYASALVFSPARSLIKRLYKSELPVHIIPPTVVGLDWNALLQTMEHNTYGSWQGVYSVCFSVDGQWLASGSYNVKVWSTSTGVCLQVLTGHEDSVQAVAFSPNNLLLASGSADNTVRIWDPVTGACKNVLHGHNDGVTSLSFSPNSSKIVSGSSDHTVKIWHATTGTCLGTFGDAGSSIASVAFLSRGEGLASGNDYSHIDDWIPSTGRLKSRDYYSRSVVAAASTADFSRVVITSARTFLEIWDPFSGVHLRTIHNHDDFYSAVLAPDGTRLALGSMHGKIEIWDTHTGQYLQTLGGYFAHISSLAFTSKAMQLASGSGDGTIRIWNLIDSPSPQTQSGQESPSDLHIFIQVLSDDLCLSADSCISVLKVWDRNTGACRTEFRNRESTGREMPTLPLSSDGKRLALASEDDYFSIWNLSTATRTQKFERECDDIGDITRAVFSSDDAFLASGSDDGIIKIWNPVTGTCLQTFEHRSRSRVKLLAITPDNMLVASVFDDGSVGVWDVANGFCRYTIQYRDVCGGNIQYRDSCGDNIVSMVFSHNSEQLALGVSPGFVCIVNGQNGSDRQTLNIDDNPVVALAFSPDNKLLASASGETGVRVWDISTETCLCMIKGLAAQLSWDPNKDSRPQTSFGEFDIPRSPTERCGREPMTKLVLAGLGINSDNTWILRQERPVLWLPPEYRPFVAAVQDDDVIISTMSKQLYWLRLPISKV